MVKQNPFFHKSTRRGWWWWRRWRRWRRRGRSIGLVSSQLCNPYRWWWCHFLLFLLSASGADWPLGWFKLPCHLLCCGWQLYCCLLHWRCDRLSCHGNSLGRWHAVGNLGSPLCFVIVVFVLFLEELTQHFRLSCFSKQVPAQFSRQLLRPCHASRLVCSSRDSARATGICVRQVWVPVTVTCHRATTQYWHIYSARSWTLRVWLPGMTKQTESSVLQQSNIEMQQQK